MIPVAFDGCAGFLHPGHSDEGVVVCGALGHETSGTHRGLLELATGLSEAGYHVLRFDYFGTGDSQGTGDEPGRLERLVRSVDRAVAFLRADRALRSVTLLGFRLGGTLACLAARRSAAIERIVLLDPVVSGRHFVREARLLASAWNAANGHVPAPNADLVVVSERYDPDFVASLSSLDTSRIAPPSSRMLILAHDRFGTAAFEQQCRACGSEVTRLPFPGLAHYLGEPVESVIPQAAFSSVISWMGVPAPRPMNLISAPASAIIDAGSAHEEPIFFGPQRDLFGVLCRPRRTARAGMPTLVFVNTGITRHTGDGRLFVEAARALATHGVASFRLDLAGIGESAANPDREGLLYDPRAQADVSAALDRLQQAGLRDFAVLGICSGAYLALQVARSDPRVTAVIMVNIQTFIWSAGRSLKVQRTNARRPTRYYLEAVLSRRGWARLSRADLSLAPICLAILKRPLLDLRRRLALQAERRLGVATRFGSVRRWIADLSDRPVDVRFWFGADDPGLATFMSWFGPAGRELRGIENVRTRLVADTDHAMQSRQARRIFTDLLLEEIETGLGRSGAPSRPTVTRPRRLPALVG